MRPIRFSALVGSSSAGSALGTTRSTLGGAVCATAVPQASAAARVAGKRDLQVIGTVPVRTCNRGCATRNAAGATLRRLVGSRPIQPCGGRGDWLALTGERQ